MANVKGRGVRVEVAATYGPAKAVTAVTLAATGVATCAAHGLADGSAGYFSGVSGMVELEGQACRVDNPAAGTFELENLDTSGYTAFSAGSFIPVATWATLAESTSYDIGGGSADKLDATTLLSNRKKMEQGLLDAESLAIGVIPQDVPSPAMKIVRAAARNQTGVLFRITLSSGAQRIVYGYPGTPGESVQKGALGSGTFDVTVPALIMLLGA